MISFLSIIKSDYLQRTRSYTFLITVCASLAIAYTFVPEPNANYSTIRIADYVGYYNASWFGYVTAIMTSLFLSLIGFYLVNSTIKTDIEVKVGQIIATTPLSNFRYLLAKTFSNFFVLCTVVLIVFLMSILLFFSYNEGFSIELIEFIKPYAIITIPTMFFISVLAVFFEVLFGRYTILQHISFFFLFSILMVFSPKDEIDFAMDVFGSKVVIHQMEETVRSITQISEEYDLTIGYVLGNTKKAKKFLFEGVNFSNSFLVSRLLWMVLGIVIIRVISPFFHRFNVRQKNRSKEILVPNQAIKTSKSLSFSSLPKASNQYKMMPLLIMELKLMWRKGKKWLWLLNAFGMLSLVLMPITIAHQLVLPILWFLQVGRLSHLATKEVYHQVHYFTFTSYRPILRSLASQVIAGILLIEFLALPLLVRFALLSEFSAVWGITLGGILIVFVAVFLGILSKGSKLFEVFFFMLTYANVNGIHYVDYFGAFEHTHFYHSKLLLLLLLVGSLSFMLRKYQLNKL